MGLSFLKWDFLTLCDLWISHFTRLSRCIVYCILYEDLENNVIKICENSNIIINPADIEGCHRLPQGRNSTTDNKRMIVKFVNRKHSELMLRSKKLVSSKSKVYISHSLCPYYRYICGKCKDLQRNGKVSQVFLSWVCCDHQSYWKWPAYEISSRKGPNGYSRMPPWSLK